MINIFLLGRFSIIVNNKDETSVIEHFPKVQLLLTCLLLHKGKSVSYNELFEVLRLNEKSKNPGSALRTLVSRTRTLLKKFDKTLEKCILSGQGSYRWNNKMDYTVDAHEFAKKCQLLLSIKAIDDDRMMEFESVHGMYIGDLNPGYEDNSWIITHRMYYHNLYLQLATHTVRLLKENRQLEASIQFCRRALCIDSFDQTMHLELIDALVRSNRISDALAQYHYAVDLYVNYMGIRPPEAIQKYYKEMIMPDQYLEIDLQNIKNSLQEVETDSGAFVCEYAIFESICRLVARNVPVMSNGMYLCVVGLAARNGQKIEASELDKAMTCLMNTIKKNLRRSDTFTRYSTSQYAILLPDVDSAIGRIVMERIQNIFFNQCSDLVLTFSYNIGPLYEAA